MVGEAFSAVAATTTAHTESTSTATSAGSSSPSTMERLELLSRTAVLKQGIEGERRRSEKASMGDDSTIVTMHATPIKITPHYQQHQNSPSSMSTTISQKHIFSVPAVNAMPSLMPYPFPNGATTNSTNRATTPVFGTSKAATNIASPVSSDGDDDHDDDGVEDDDVVNEGGHEANQADLSDRSNGSHGKRRNQKRHPVIESRSPVATVDYTRGRDAPPLSYGTGSPLTPARFESFHHTGGHVETSLVAYPTSVSAPSAGAYHRAGEGGFYHQPHQHPGRDQGSHHTHHSHAPFLPSMSNHSGPQYHLHEHHRSVTRSSTPTSGASVTDEHDPHHHAHHAHHPQSLLQPRRHEDGNPPPHKPSYGALAQEVQYMREQLKEKDIVVSSLQHRVNHLENQINELRQLPTGKISHIPVDDMIRIMQEFGSEVSNQTLPQRKQAIKKASIVRQFRRWNPEFFRFFVHVNGEWVPKLGRDGELRRRAEKRRLAKHRGGDDDGTTI